MAAKDYVFVTGMAAAYLTKKTKGPAMSQDRRIVMDNEIIGLFEFFLRIWVATNKQDTITITDGKGKKLFQATLLDKD